MRDALIDVAPAGAPGARSPFLTYEPYYGLTEKAFSLSADPRFLYKSRAHAPMFDELRAGIRRREGIIVLTGEPGTGKTTLCRGVLSALDRKTFSAFVPDPFVSREDLLKMLLIEFGVMSVDDVKSGRLRAATRPELSYPLYDFLRSLVPLQAYAVLIIDEAQNLASQLLEEIRILTDLEGPEKLLQLVLVGQPELREKLKDPAMSRIASRLRAAVPIAWNLHPRRSILHTTLRTEILAFSTSSPTNRCTADTSTERGSSRRQSSPLRSAISATPRLRRLST
jgi:type II secretory pathway predicted ATPase ExeA